MKRFDRLFFFGQVALDIIAINIGFMLAHWARYDLELIREVAVENYVSIGNYIPIQLALSAILLIVFAFKGLYRLPRRANFLDEFMIIISSSTIALAVLIGVVFFYRPVFYSRLIFGFSWVSIIVMLAITRYALRRLKMFLWSRGIGVERVLVVGAGPAGQRVMQGILEKPDWGYQLVGYVHDGPDDLLAGFAGQNNGNCSLKCLGGTTDTTDLIKQQSIDEVVIALPGGSRDTNQSIVETCRQQGVSFRLVPHLYEMSFNEVAIDEVNGIPLIGVKDTSITGTNYYIKRSMDLVSTSALLVVLSPVMGIISLAIKLDSPGPVLFKQVRVGKRGAQFTFYKFRSMVEDAEKRREDLEEFSDRDGIHFKMKNDPRMTRVGKALRRTSLDELPQLFNILLGEMSWVGPRPPIPAEVEKYVEWHRKRLEVTPGLTGLWQVSGRADLSFDEMVRLDLYYAENWSLWLDLKILLLTIPAVISGRGAY